MFISWLVYVGMLVGLFKYVRLLLIFVKIVCSCVGFFVGIIFGVMVVVRISMWLSSVLRCFCVLGLNCCKVLWFV